MKAPAVVTKGVQWVLAHRRRSLVIFIVAMAVLGVISVFFPIAWHRTSLNRYADFPALTPADRLTIVSPHLDDETLGVGGVIAQATSQHVPVSVIFMTNGDDFPIAADFAFGTGYPTPAQLLASGEQRQQEALKAVAALGISPKDVYFLGLPDRGLQAIFSSAHQTVPYKAPGTLESSSVYPLSYQANLPYTGQAATAALKSALAVTKPTIILTTAPQDIHTDHSTTAKVVRSLQTNMPGVRLVYFLIHYHGYPRPRGVNSESDLLPPEKLQNLSWQVFYLSDKERTQKQGAINDYASQLRVPEIGGLMRAMLRRNELLLPQS